MKKQFVLFILFSFLILSTNSLAQTGLNGIPVGSTTPNTGKFTNLEATTDLTLGGDTITSFDDINDGKVKASTSDTSPGFLDSKIVGGAGINIDTTNPNQVTISSTSSGQLTTKGDVLIHDGTSETRLPVGASGQYLTSDVNNNLLWTNPPEGDQLFNSNVLLNAFRTSGLVSPAQPLQMVNGVVDAFNSETGVDATSSTNEDYESGGDFYDPTRSGTITIPTVNFDGVDDYINRGSDLTGNADSKVGTLSFWLTPTSSGSTESWILSAGSSLERFYVRHANDAIAIFATDTNSSIVLSMSSVGGSVSSGQLTHVLASWDLANSKAHLYINGVDMTGSPTKVNGNIDYTISDWVVGGRALGGGTFYTTYYAKGTVAQLWFSTSQYIDITNVTNREKFRDALGNPVDLGANGSTPTGSQPILYLNNTLSTWQNNLGSGGNFSVNGGGLTAGTNLSTSGTPDNMTLVSESQIAKTEANGANIVLFAEDPAADIVLNTDVKASVSRDGGTTFTQVTLSDAGEFEKGNLLTGTVDISSQPTGTDMQWKVETDNNKALNLHGVGLEWR